MSMVRVAKVRSELQGKSINVFSFLFLLTLLSGMGFEAFDIMPLKLLSYVSECILIVYTYIKSIRHGLVLYPELFFVALVLILNFLFTPYTPKYVDLLKYFGYYGCFLYGNYLARNCDYLKINTIFLYTIVILPVVLVAFFDQTILKNYFFHSPNGFVYLGVAIGAFYLIVKGHEKKYFVRSILIIFLYILICTSLGVVVAALLSILVLNLKRNHIPYLLVGGLLGAAAIRFIDIPLFIRIRDVLNVWEYLFDSKIGSIEDVDFVELNQLDRAGDRKDTTSSVWRLVQWTRVFKMYIEQIWTIPFGMGAGFTVEKTGLYPHNDFLLVLVEYGLVVFSFFFKFVHSIYKRLKHERMIIYFILTMFLYHFTDNLLSNFPPGVLLYFVVGWSLYKFRNNPKNHELFNTSTVLEK